MPYEKLREVTAEQLTRYYDLICKELMRAKQLIELDSRIVGDELELKKIIINRLEETRTYMLLAKSCYDDIQKQEEKDRVYGFVAAYLEEVGNRIYHVTKVQQRLKKKYPLRTDAELEQIIAKQYKRIDEMYGSVIYDPAIFMNHVQQ